MKQNVLAMKESAEGHSKLLSGKELHHFLINCKKEI